MPNITPRKASKAVMVPTISSPRGRFQMLANEKYNVPKAGNSIWAIHLRIS